MLQQPIPPQQAQPRQPTVSPVLARQYAALGTVLGIGGVFSGIVSALMLIMNSSLNGSIDTSNVTFSAAVVASIAGIILGINSYDKLREAGVSRMWGIASIVCSTVVAGLIVLWLLFFILHIVLLTILLSIHPIQM